MNKSKIADHSQKMLGTALASTVLAAALMATPIVASAGAKSERCADVVKAGSNSCAVKSLGISCQGHATEDNLKGAWIKVPKGTCANIVSICAGDAEAPEGTNAKKLAKACGKLAEQEEGVEGGRLVDKMGEPIVVLDAEHAAEEMAAEADAVEAEAEALESEADALEAEAESMTDEADAMQEKADAIEGEAESMTDKVESVKDQAEDLKAKAEAMQDKVEGMQEAAEEVVPAVE